MRKYFLRFGVTFSITAVFLFVFYAQGGAPRAVAVSPWEQLDDSAASRPSWYGDNWYQLGPGFGGTITSLTIEGSVDSPDHFNSAAWLKEFSDAGYTQLTNTYGLGGPPFEFGTPAKITISGLDIPTDPNKYYRLDTMQYRQNSSVILWGTNATGTGMEDDFSYGIGRVERPYSFYPYITLTATGLTHEPVVIVPGIMGSVLDRASDGAEIWPNATTMATSFSDSYLDALADDPNLVPSDILREATGSLNILPFVNIGFGKVFYKNLIDAFVKEGYVENQNLFVVPYDWRAGVGAAANVLAPKIAAAVAASPDGKINIIAHSMGGLLVKKYLAGLSDTGFLDKLVLAGVPQLGAPDTFKLLEYGDNLGINFGPFDVLNPQEIKKVAQNMPSVYELLPSRKYVGVAGGYVHDFRNGGNEVFGYDETKPLVSNGALWDAASVLHDDLDARPVNAPNVYNIVGCLNPTPTGFDLYDNGAVDIERGGGDGTVPSVSAMNLADGFNNFFVLNNETGIDHMGLASDDRTLALIKDIIDGVSTVTLPQGISASLADCVTPRASASETTFEFSVHGSSTTLDVYDSAGRHTGPLATGDIELGIPGSEYETIGDNAFILVPATSTAYKAVVHGSPGTATSTAAIKVKGYSGGEKQKQTAYLPVSLINASATAELDFDGFDKGMDLRVDESGDGTADAFVPPVATLSTPSSTADVTPPLIVPPTIPATVAQHTTTTVIWSATDDESGIATTTATLNGASVTSGEVITLDMLGKNVFIVDAMDNAGNVSESKIEFTVVGIASPCR